MHWDLQFTDAEQAELQRALEKVSLGVGWRMTLDELLGRWAQFVSGVEDGYEDCIYVSCCQDVVPMNSGPSTSE